MANSELGPRQEPPSPTQDKELDETIHSETLGEISAEDREFLNSFTEEKRKKVLWKACNNHFAPILAILLMVFR